MSVVPMKRVLFVDDEPNVLSGLKRMLHGLRGEWDMAFAPGGLEALAQMEKAVFDVVVSDVRMPGMDGVELLTQVKQRYPDTVRIILSGHAERESLLRAVGQAHQFLSKPCSSDQIKNTVKRALALRDLLASERLGKVTARIMSLPTLPALYLEIQKVLGDPNGSIETVGRIVAKDIGMSAKVLQLVNSAFFGVPQRMTNPVEATVYIGLDTINALVLTSQVFAETHGVKAHTLERLWTHSLRAGAFARAIARMESLPTKEADQAFLAGMLHEVGLLVLTNELRDELASAWRMARKLGIPTFEAERRVIGASHAAVGAYLLGIWGLPDAVVEAIAFHHTPAACPHDKFSLVTAVHVATYMDSEGNGSALGQLGRELDLEYLKGLGLSERLAVWREGCHAMLAQSAA